MIDSTLLRSCIISYLRSHRALSLRRIEVLLDIPCTTLHRAISTGRLPDRYLCLLYDFLRDYGLII